MRWETNTVVSCSNPEVSGSYPQVSENNDEVSGMGFERNPKKTKKKPKILRISFDAYLRDVKKRGSFGGPAYSFPKYNTHTYRKRGCHVSKIIN